MAEGREPARQLGLEGELRIVYSDNTGLSIAIYVDDQNLADAIEGITGFEPKGWKVQVIMALEPPG